MNNFARNRARLAGKLFLLAALCLVAVAFIVNYAISQTATAQKVNNADSAELWQDIAESRLTVLGERRIVPDKYRVVRLNRETLNNLLAGVPMEFTEAARTSETVLTLPLPDNKFSQFKIQESPIMAAELAAQFPEIKTYSGQGVDDPTATLRFDVTPAGFHAQILRAGGDTVYIDPYSVGDTQNYISYFKVDLSPDGKDFACKFTGERIAPIASGAEPIRTVSNGSALRKYRLALAANGEYTQFHGGTVAGAMSAMTTTMNRVNGLYERDFAVRMEFVSNNASLIFTDPTLDPYTNEDGVRMLAQNQATVDALINPINYDIGHVFSTGGGGVALLASVCSTGTKAGGVTGSRVPRNDAFDVDYVAHEMGHQFGGNHTFNGSTGSCSGNESSDTAMEPGSGTTIQAYAGICGAQDLQRNSDDHFHVRSLEEMVAHINGAGNCSVNTPTGNTIPTVNGGADIFIPRDTPFALTATASDADGNALTYLWEEYDTGAASTPGNDNDNDGAIRPLFRSFSPSTNPTRIFPSMRFILNNANQVPQTYNCGRATPCTTGEDLPSVARTMTFQITARDNRAGAGAINTDTVAVNVDAGSGPFVVTAPNTNVQWAINSQRIVTWNVANTNVAPVSCPNVNILLSTDGGNTFPTALASNTTNDGTETITVPNIATSTTARVLVECAQPRTNLIGTSSTFFDVSNQNFRIVTATAATASISGRVTTAAGRPLRFVTIRLVGANNVDLTATTDARGNYRFDNVPAGDAYIVRPSRSRIRFAPESHALSLQSATSNLDFTAQ